MHTFLSWYILFIHNIVWFPWIYSIPILFVTFSDLRAGRVYQPRRLGSDPFQLRTHYGYVIYIFLYYSVYIYMYVICMCIYIYTIYVLYTIYVIHSYIYMYMYMIIIHIHIHTYVIIPGHVWVMILNLCQTLGFDC